MRSVLVVNSKGGCGKTTIATNLAGAFCQNGMRATLADADPQKSSLQWVQRRPPELARIRALDWSDGITKVKKSVDRLVIDAPAGVTPPEFKKLLRMADDVVLPILPSALDQIAAITFLGRIEMLKPIRKNRKRVAVVANRVRAHTRAGRALSEFLESFNHPPVMTLPDSVLYVDSANSGISIFDRRDRASRAAQAQWVDLIGYLESAT